MASRLKTGIIGAGRIGKIHAENIARFIPQAVLEGITDINLTAEQENWAKNLGARIVSKDPGDLLKDSSIEAIAICAPSLRNLEGIIFSAIYKSAIRLDSLVTPNTVI